MASVTLEFAVPEFTMLARVHTARVHTARVHRLFHTRDTTGSSIPQVCLQYEDAWNEAVPDIITGSGPRVSVNRIATVAQAESCVTRCH